MPKFNRMKKHFTLVAGLLLGICSQGLAQSNFPLAENFEGTPVGTTLPNGWTQINPGGGWKIHEGAIDYPNTPSWRLPKHSRFAVVNDWAVDSTRNDSTLLVTPQMDLTGVTGATLGLDFYFIGASWGNAASTEAAKILASTDGGATWKHVFTLTGNSRNWQSAYIALDSFDNEDTFQLAFSYFDARKKLIGLAVDDIRVYNRTAGEVALQSVTLPQLMGGGFASNGTVVRFAFDNTGSAPITGIEATYSIDGGTPVTQTFTSLNVAPGASAAQAFSTAIAGLTAGTHDLLVTITKVNGATDPYMDDNSGSASFLGSLQVKDRPCFIEEFTSSTCVPCANFNVGFDPLIEANNVNKASANFNIIKYQMNWPSPGNDYSYNAHGDTRKSYYGVSGIPDHYTHGLPGGSGDQTEIDECKGGITPIEITGSYTIMDKENLKASVTVKPLMDLNGNYTLHVAAVEKQYENKFATTTQRDYIHVMRLMMPNGNGTKISSMTSGTNQDFNFTSKYTTWTDGVAVKQMSNTFWTHPMNSNLVVFLQDNNSKEVLQSFVVEAKWPTSVEEKNAGVTMADLYPNPATDQTSVVLSLEKQSNVQIHVIDAMGRVVFVKEAKQLAPGTQTIDLPTREFAAGLYNVKIQTEKGGIVKRLSVIK